MVRLVANLKVTREEFQVIYDQGADAVYALVEGLLLQVNLLTARVQQLENHASPTTEVFVTTSPVELQKTFDPVSGLGLITIQENH
jgi:hypothetical protein